MNPQNERVLIVNADDLGLSPGVNQGIFAAHERGIVTSASLMVRWDAAIPAAAYAKSSTTLSVGLHVDIGEWFYRDGAWTALYEVVQSDDRAALETEVAAQLARFRALMERDPSHIDSHQHVHRSRPLASITQELAHELGVPLRHRTNEIRYEGKFYGQSGDGEPYPSGIMVDSLIELLSDLPPGVTELGCHPGFAADIESMYRDERAIEVETLCDPRVCGAIQAQGIRLANFLTIDRVENNETRATNRQRTEMTRFNVETH